MGSGKSNADRSGNSSRRSRLRERGQATVELALTLPLAVLFALLVLQAGLVAKDLILVNHAAREAARAAAVDPTVASARAGAVGGSNLDSGRLSVTLAGGTNEGDKAIASVSYDSPTNVPLVGWLIGDVHLQATVTMRVE